MRLLSCPAFRRPFRVCAQPLLTRPRAIVPPTPVWPWPKPIPASPTTPASRPFASLSAVDACPSVISSLSHALLDLIPFPNSSYTLSIVLITLAIRACVGLPVSVFARSSARRFQRLVLPEFQRFKAQTLRNARRSGFDDPVQIGLYRAHLQRVLQTRFRRLLRQHRCHPLVAMLVSTTINVPVFYLATAVLHRIPLLVGGPASSHPIAQEQLLFLGSPLVDSSLGLSLVTWLAFLINLELNHHLRRSAHNLLVSSKSRADDRWILISKLWNPSTFRTGSFLVGILMMGVSSTQPSLVLVYWLTSNLFSIAQSLVFHLLDSADKASTLKDDSLPPKSGSNRHSNSGPRSPPIT